MTTPASQPDRMTDERLAEIAKHAVSLPPEELEGWSVIYERRDLLSHDAALSASATDKTP